MGSVDAKRPERKNMVRVTWLARHPMGADQIEDLAAALGHEVEEIQVTSKNVTWQASSDACDEQVANKATWQNILATTDLVAGVFPPVALEARPEGITVLSPVSRQSKEVRADGTATIEFHHVRWARF